MAMELGELDDGAALDEGVELPFAIPEPGGEVALPDELLTFSRGTAWRTCARLEYYAYQLRVRPIHLAEPLVFGTAGHHGAEGYWRARQDGLGIVACADAAYAAVPDTLSPFSAAKLRTLLRAYVALWHSRTVEVISVEQTFKTALRHPVTGEASPHFALGGKLDVLAHFPRVRGNGIIEHKFTTNNLAPGGEYSLKLNMDPQCDQYFVGAEALGFAADFVIYDVITKPQQRPFKATPSEKRVEVTDRVTKQKRLKASQREDDETPEQYGARLDALVAKDPGRFLSYAQVSRTHAQRDEFAGDVWGLAGMMTYAREAGIAPRNPDACFRYKTPCSYWPVCSGRASIDDPTRYRVAETAHEELAFAEAATE